MKSIPLSRINSILLFGILSVIVLFYAKEVLIPIIFSILLAMLFAPLANKLEKKKISPLISSLICTLIIVIALFIILGLISAQIVSFSNNSEAIQNKFEGYFQEFQFYIEKKLNISSEKQISLIKEEAKQLNQLIGDFFKTLVAGFFATMASITLIILFTFLFLLQRDKYEKFIIDLYPDNRPEETIVLIRKITKVSQRYIAGRFLSIIILTVFYTIGLTIIGINNALLLSSIAALLTVVPYVGTVIGGIFPIFMAISTEDTIYPALAVAGVFILIQTIDNYFVEPFIVGGEVSLNVITSILAIIIGGIVWGISGMILFIPMIGIVKIVCDHIKPLQPYGFLLGDQEMERPSNKIWNFISKQFKKED